MAAIYTREETSNRLWRFNVQAILRATLLARALKLDTSADDSVSQYLGREQA